MRLIFCIALLLAPATAHAGTSWIELVPETSGPYQPGSFLDVDVVFHYLEAEYAFVVRLVTLDFRQSDPGLKLPDTFQFQLVPPLIADALYYRFETMPKVDIVNSVCGPVAGFCIELHEGDSFLLGTLGVGLPDDPGTYVLDAMNRSAPDTNTGARVDYMFLEDGFAERSTLHWLNGNLGGGQLAMTVMPDPTTLVLLALGGIGACVCRRCVRG